MASGDLEGHVWEALKGVRFPGMSRDIVSFGFVQHVKEAGGQVEVELLMSTHNPAAAEKVRVEAERRVLAVAGVAGARVTIQVQKPAGAGAAAGREDAGAGGHPHQKAVAQDGGLVPGVRHLVAVASGKGGVGKSTVAANLALSLSRLGYATGLLDVDIYGPSIPTMFGIQEKPRLDGNRILPFEKYGIRLMSLGFILEADTPVIWRGPMVMRAIEQMLGDVEWGKLDYMVLDLPPGTGDAQLTVTQKIPLAGAVIVTTPQEVALIDARKAMSMFKKVNVPVLGIVENMSSFVCPCCGHVTDIFKKGGGARTADLLGTAYLGAVPLDPRIVEGGDAGVPIVVAEPDGEHAAAFRRIAEVVAAEVARHGAQQSRLSIV